MQKARHCSWPCGGSLLSILAKLNGRVRVLADIVQLAWQEEMSGVPKTSRLQTWRQLTAGCPSVCGPFQLGWLCCLQLLNWQVAQGQTPGVCTPALRAGHLVE